MLAQPCYGYQEGSATCLGQCSAAATADGHTVIQPTSCMTAEAMKWVSINQCISASVSGCSVPWGPRSCPLRCTVSGKSRLRSTPALQVQLSLCRLPANTVALCWAVEDTGQEVQLPHDGPYQRESQQWPQAMLQSCVSRMVVKRCTHWSSSILGTHYQTVGNSS